MDVEIRRKMRRAIADGDLGLVKEMIATHEGLKDTITGYGSWLHVASDKGQFDIVKYFVELGLDINQYGGFADAGPIRQACLNGYLDIVKYLYEHGAELDISTAVRNPLFTAINDGHFDIVKFLVEKGIDITIRYTSNSLDNEGAYEFARTYGKEEIAEYLKEKLIDTDYFSANRKDHNPWVNR
jgi:uncharacterized protein